MAWTSSTAVVSAGSNGVISTTSNNALIENTGYGWSGDYLEVYGSNDTVIGSWYNDSIGAVMYPALGMNGNNTYIESGTGNDILVAVAMQGEQHATLVGGAGNDTFGIGSNLDSKLDVTISDFWVGVENIRIYYEGYQPGSFTCYSTDSGLLFTDNAGRLTVTLSNVYDYNSVADKYIQVYPYGYRGAAIPRSAWQYVTVGSVVNYGGNLSSAYDNTIVIDNTQSTQGRYLGGNAQANQIYAGAGGDTLWGAANDDILIGGAGADVFEYGAGEGADFVAGADAFDTVNLYNLNLSDIAAVIAENNTITLAQDAADAVTIQYNGALSPTFTLADGSRWQFDNTTSAWQQS